MNNIQRTLAAASALLMGSSVSAAPLVLEGNFVKIGVNDAGTVGSGNGTSPGILYDSTGTSTFNPSYDYLTPGSPFEGWTIKGTDADGNILFNHINNNASYANVDAVTGTLVDYSGVEFKGATYDNRAYWSGETDNFKIDHDYRFNDNQEFVDIQTDIELKIAVPILWFGRYTDPDAQAAAGDSSSTLNTLGYSGIPATNVVFSEALASKYALGLFTGASSGVGAGISNAWSTDPITYHAGTNDGDGDYTIGLGFKFENLSAGDIVSIQYAYIFGPSAFDAGSTAVSSGAGGSSGSGFVVEDVGSASDPTPAPTPDPTPDPVTETGSSTEDVVTTSTSEVSRTVEETDADGNPVVKTYTDTVTTTTTTPTTTTTYSDGSSTTSEGTASSTSEVTGTTLASTAVTRPSIVFSDAPVAGLPVVKVKLTEHTASESGGVQKIARKHTTTKTTGMTRTYVNTPVTTTTAADGTETVSEGTPETTWEFWNDIDISYAHDALYGRVDQLEALDNIGGAINGLLNHEPSQTKERLRVFENNHFAQSYNGDGYTADSKVFGGGMEFDITKGWTIGAQYNTARINMTGSDSKANLRKEHFGIFNAFHGNTLSLNTNAGMANNKYDYTRTVEGVFDNAGKTEGKEWWVTNRLYLHLASWLHPFVGHTVQNVRRDAYNETGSIQSARRVEEYNQTTHVGEAGLKLETRFGGKKKDLFGMSVEGSYGTDNSYGVTASVDYREVITIEGTHGVSDGMTTNSIAGKVKFRF